MGTTSIIATKTTGALDAAGNLAEHVGSAAGNVFDATKTAGKQVGSVASDEMTKLKAELDDLIARIPSLSDIDLSAAKQRLLEQVATARDAANQATLSAREKLNQGVEVAGGYVKEKPLQSVAVAAGIGILIGMLIARSK
ncbi:DUF883 family protein [Undibacterium sp.]|jgi:ElaB/YqjD/DUF883 family membrane-anchored ribosome-binding protein|uniref:DUF883 family protein n=1 Tax=Undibacterium sp. TaxID=1914977 RepID=UPI002C7A77B1|nr:hypothetical protein [Undibacterium sp.]HTD02188.1 hypothetical protein [Undibacterium sp.]